MQIWKKFWSGSKSNCKREELKLRYIRFYHKVDRVYRPHNYKFFDLGIIGPLLYQ